MRFFKEYLFEFILSIFVLTLIVLLAAPYLFGYKIQSTYEEYLDLLASKTDHRFEVVHHDRGWFTTSANLLVKDKENQPLLFFRHQIIHGPVYLGLIFKGESPFVNMVVEGEALPAKEAPSLFSRLFLNDPIQVYATLSLNDDGYVKVKLPEINKTFDESRYKIGHAGFDINYLAKNNRFVGELVVNELQFGSDSPLEVSKLITNFEQVVNQEHISGDVVVSLDAAKFKLNNTIASIKQFSSRIKNRKSGITLDTDVDINASTINIFNEQINSLSLGITFSSIYINLLESLITNLASEDSSDPDWNIYSGMQLKPFSFFSEHGAFNSNVTLSLRPEYVDSDFHHRYQTDFSLEVSNNLLKRLYEIVTTDLDKEFRPYPEFIKLLRKQNFLEMNAHKIFISLKSDDEKYIINDLIVAYPDFENSLIDSLFVK